MGVKPGKEQVPVNLHDFQRAVKGKVDFYQSADRKDFPSFDEKIIQVPMSDKQQAAYKFVMGRYPTLAYKIRHGLPLHKSEQSNFQSFMIGPRQISNHPGPFNTSAKDTDAPKLKVMADQVESRYKKDPHFRGVIYSNFLESGLEPVSRELARRGIPSQMFTGQQGDQERKQIVDNYNSGKLHVLLISGAGAEGLDLKGTKLLQIMEPHWQEELIDQVRGRVIRYRSHSHLPADERHVEVQRFHSIPPPSFWDRMLGRKRSPEKSADEYLYELANKKRDLNNVFLNVLKGQSPTEIPAAKAAEEQSEFGSYIPVNDKLYPGLLVDLDGTLVGSPKGRPKELGQQSALPGRLETLTALKSKGYRIIGVTNRSVYPGDTPDFTPQCVHGLIQETMALFPGLLEDVIFLPFGPTEHHKPAPTMLWYAMAKYSLDPSDTLMVGDSEDDRKAAEAAGVPFVDPEEFFQPNLFNGLPDTVPTIQSGEETL